MEKRTSILTTSAFRNASGSRSRERLRNLVAALATEDRLVLVVTHDMDFVGEACPRTVVLTHGEVVHAGPTGEAFQNPTLIARAGLEAPHVTQLAKALGLATTVDEAGFLARIGQPG